MAAPRPAAETTPMAEPTHLLRTSPLSLLADPSLRGGEQGAHLGIIQSSGRLLRSCSEPHRQYRVMADFLSVVGIVIFTVAMLALIKAFEHV
jgi:hypothetical protein